MGTISNFRNLDVWQKAHQLTLEVYRITKNYPQDEKFGLTSQMRRAAVSVPANIVEGFRKFGIKDKVNFYNIAHASLDELRYYFLLSKDLAYINEENLKSLDDSGEEISMMLNGLISSTKRRKIFPAFLYALFPALL
ncbi:MAG: four helix bundle protein [Bacteroidetes bacterium]|nr:four helix bundle protein [Bacteroidota bacterium]